MKKHTGFLSVFAAACLMWAIGSSNAWSANEMLTGTRNNIFFTNVENVFDAQGNYKSSNAMELAVGDHLVGIFSVQNIDADGATIFFQGAQNQLSGIFAQRVEAIVQPDTYDESGLQALPHLVFGPPTITTFCRGTDCFSTATRLAAGEMMAFFRQSGADSTTFTINGPMATDVARATDGTKWLSLSYDRGSDGIFGTDDDNGYFYGHWPLGVPLLNFEGDAFGGLNTRSNNTRYSFCGVNDLNENEMGGFTLLNDLVFTSELERNPTATALGGTSPWDIRSNDPATMFPCEIARLGDFV